MAMSTPPKAGNTDTLPPMSTQSAFTDIQLRPICRIAVRAAADAIVWLGKVFLFFATVAFVSVAVAMLATTAVGGGALIISAMFYLRYVPIRPTPMLSHHQ
ncbi:hypothetical protein BN903_415 [Halorubrum sp. AJ67]|nr:hypothetical protein BN903_415 [Halorubrum sp. AJ67]